MFLSNLGKYFLLAPIFALFLLACGSSQTNENRPVEIKVETKSEFPFSTKEPEVYQADIVAGAGGVEDKWFAARKGDKWRIDFFVNGELVYSQIRNDRMFSIDHKKKSYSSEPVGSAESTVFTELTANFFSGKEYREFEEVSRQGGLVKYKVRKSDVSKDEIMIDIDTKTGVIVKQEFSAADGSAKFVYEVKNLKTEVDDSIFSIPAGFREAPDTGKKTK